MTQPDLKGRLIGDCETLREQIATWSNPVTTRQRAIEWRMNIDDARCGAESAYPKII